MMITLQSSNIQFSSFCPIVTKNWTFILFDKTCSNCLMVLRQIGFIQTLVFLNCFNPILRQRLFLEAIVSDTNSSTQTNKRSQQYIKYKKAGHNFMTKISIWIRIVIKHYYYRSVHCFVLLTTENQTHFVQHFYLKLRKTFGK